MLPNNEIRFLFNFVSNYKSLMHSVVIPGNLGIEQSMEELDMSKLVDEEDAATGSVGIAVYLSYCKSIGIISCVLTIALSTLRYASSIYASSK